MTDIDINYNLKAQYSNARIRKLSDSHALEIADRIARINSRVIPFSRDVVLDAKFRQMLLSLTVPTSARPDKRRILAICGESGAGKSTALATHTKLHEALKPYVDEDGVEISPLLIYDAPNPCLPRLIAIEGLRKMGLDVRDNLRENEAWARFRKMLVKHKINVVVIDEAQNAIETATDVEVAKIADAFKQLTQMPDWPVRLVLSGVPPLGAFVARKQLKNRTTIVKFLPISVDDDLEMLQTIVQKVIVDHAQLRMHTSLGDDFCRRLAHAYTRDLGTIIQAVREAVELVLYAKRDSVHIDDFAAAYASASGCKSHHNIFKAADWENIDPMRSSFTPADEAWETARSERKRRRGNKSVVRPT